MVVAGHVRALRDGPDPAPAVERQRPEVAAAVEMYLKLTGGEPRQALALAVALAVADAVDASRLVSRGFARWGGPARSL